MSIAPIAFVPTVLLELDPTHLQRESAGRPTGTSIGRTNLTSTNCQRSSDVTSMLAAPVLLELDPTHTLH
jgi:hypothetical protein